MRADEIGRGRVSARNGDVEPLARDLVQQHVDQREQERGVGLGLDRHPLGRAGAGDRQVRLDLHALHAAHARVGVAPDADDAAGGLDVGAAGDEVIGERRVGRDGEGAVPELAVQVLGVVALDALARAEAHVDRAPRGEERREGAHVRLRRAGAAEAHGEARIAGFVGQPARAELVELGGDDVERLVPRDRHEARILVAALLRVGALHRRRDPVRVVGLLHQAVGLDADLAAAGMHVGRAEVRLDLGGDAVDDLHRQQVRSGDALVAVRRHVARAASTWLIRSPIPPSGAVLRRRRLSVHRDPANLASECGF